MEIFILKNRKVLIFSIIFVTVISLGVFIQGCSMEEDEPLDEAILNSSELEEYIIAGADFQKSLAVFTATLNKIDLSMLDSSFNSEGRKVLYLPASVGSIQIEKKIQSFNEKRDALLKKFPQFTSFRKDISKEYFQHSIKNSVNVKTEFLKLGINPSKLKLKSDNETIWSGNCNGLDGFLNSWVNSAGYVEVVILYYYGGDIDVIQVPGASQGSTNPLTFQTQGGMSYYNSRAVWNVGHTHTDDNGADTPSDPEDYWNLPGTTQFIYYNGSYIYY